MAMSGSAGSSRFPGLALQAWGIVVWNGAAWSLARGVGFANASGGNAFEVGFNFTTALADVNFVIDGSSSTSSTSPIGLVRTGYSTGGVTVRQINAGGALNAANGDSLFVAVYR